MMILFSSVLDSVSSFPAVTCSPSTVSLYLRYLYNYVIILAVSFMVLSSTYLGLFITASMLLTGPLTFLVIFPSLILVGAPLFYLGLFPVSLFFKIGGGIVAPFVNLPSVSFFLANLIVPLSSAEFIVENIPDRTSAERIALLKRSKSHSFISRLANSVLIVCLNYCTCQTIRGTIYFVQTITILFLGLKMPEWVSSLLLVCVEGWSVSFRCASTWSLYIANDSFIEYCLLSQKNAALFVGFGLPIAAARSVLTDDMVALGLIISLLEMGVLFGMVGRMVNTVKR